MQLTRAPHQMNHPHSSRNPEKDGAHRKRKISHPEKRLPLWQYYDCPPPPHPILVCFGLGLALHFWVLMPKKRVGRG